MLINESSGPAVLENAQDLEQTGDMGFYRPKEKLTERVTTFLPRPQKERMDRLVRVWSAVEEIRNPGEKAWTDAEAARRLIEAAIDGAWHELGGEPETEEQLQRVIESATNKAKMLMEAQARHRASVEADLVKTTKSKK